ncbi:hypothetical protein J8F10_01695 [Gemmata sp. G18]|uniref:Uncharacterized protein n=1 Tax=Gemmata palustris TaxID=2822762 RepID=A0ABS5BJY1_9BACT|nr:hypothetical protein [Gemmata palustris]MBP3954011.1 hypothetical protein [Gemmata palustris]
MANQSTDAARDLAAVQAVLSQVEKGAPKPRGMALKRERIDQPATVPAVAGVDVETDPAVIAARQKAADLRERWLGVCDELADLTERTGLQPGQRPEPGQLDELIVAAMLAGRAPIEEADVQRLQALTTTERCSYEAAKQAAAAVWPAIESAKRRAVPAIEKALAPAARDFALGLVTMIRAGMEFSEQIARFERHGWGHSMPNIVFRPGMSVGTNPYDAQALIRELLNAGALTSADVSDLPTG